jgi:predicted CXXCH cytochrome family protein
MHNKLPKHILRLLILLGLLAVIFIAAKVLLTDPSYYKYGYYRADSVPELAAGEPLYKGTPYCLSCHADSQQDTSTGAHVNVECEVCHGINREHPDNSKMLIPADTIKLCLTCHQAMPARPARQPQIVVGEHPVAGMETPPCQTCHNPHSPGDEGPAADAPGTDTQAGTVAESAASVPASVSKCGKCHGKQGQGRGKNPALAGMESAAFIEQMNQFKTGARENKMMAKYAQQLSDEEMMELALYYEGLAAAPAD